MAAISLDFTGCRKTDQVRKRKRYVLIGSNIPLELGPAKCNSFTFAQCWV